MVGAEYSQHFKPCWRNRGCMWRWGSAVPTVDPPNMKRWSTAGNQSWRLIEGTLLSRINDRDTSTGLSLSIHSASSPDKLVQSVTKRELADVPLIRSVARKTGASRKSGPRRHNPWNWPQTWLKWNGGGSVCSSGKYLIKVVLPELWDHNVSCSLITLRLCCEEVWEACLSSCHSFSSLPAFETLHDLQKSKHSGDKLTSARSRVSFLHQLKCPGQHPWAVHWRASRCTH